MPYCPRCGYAYTVDEIPQQEIVTDNSRPRNCHTGKHTWHIWVPWMHGAKYDKLCDICGYEAAWVSGGGVALCDCCAQDWSDWNDKHHGLSGHTRLDKIWMPEYLRFKDYARGKAAQTACISESK